MKLKISTRNPLVQLEKTFHPGFRRNSSHIKNAQFPNKTLAQPTPKRSIFQFLKAAKMWWVKILSSRHKRATQKRKIKFWKCLWPKMMKTRVEVKYKIVKSLLHFQERIQEKSLNINSLRSTEMLTTSKCHLRKPIFQIRLLKGKNHHTLQWKRSWAQTSLCRKKWWC